MHIGARRGVESVRPPRRTAHAPSPVVPDKHADLRCVPHKPKIAMSQACLSFEETANASKRRRRRDPHDLAQKGVPCSRPSSSREKKMPRVFSERLRCGRKGPCTARTKTPTRGLATSPYLLHPWPVPGRKRQREREGGGEARKNVIEGDEEANRATSWER